MPKISALPAMVAGDLTTADLLPVVDSTGPTTRKTTIDIFRVDFFAGVGMTATPLAIVTTITATGMIKTTVTTQQLSLNYDGSNHLAVTVSSAGAVTYNATGASASHIFSDVVTASVGGTVTTNGWAVTSGNLSVGTTGLAATTGINVSSSALTGVSQWGIDVTTNVSSDATTAGYGIRLRVVTATAAYTQTNAYGAYISNAGLGGGSTLTNQYGLYVATISGAATINYGIYVGGGTPAIYVATGGVNLVGAAGNTFAVGDATVSPGILITGKLGAITGTSQSAIGIYGSAHSSGTVAITGLSVQITTAAAAFTCTNFYGIYVDAVAKGAGSTITNRYGLYVVNPTDGGTLNRAVYISGAAAVVESQGRYIAMSGTAVPATAGAAAAGAPFTANSNGMTIEWTTDAPTHTRPKGSLCLNLGGSSTSTRAYINTDGAGTWTAITTAA